MASRGEMLPGELLPAVVAALNGNYVRVWGALSLAGEALPAGTNAIAIDIPHRGSYIPNGNFVVDGASYQRGEMIELGEGPHIASGGRDEPIILWRGTRLPAPPPAKAGNLFTNFLR